MKKELGVEMVQFGESCDSGRRESTAPRIVVSSPSEEKAAPAARGARLLRALARRVLRRGDGDAGSSDSASSGSSSDSSESSGRPRARSAVSLRRVFRALGASARSLSSSPPERPRPPKKNPQPQRILRSPVTYTYVRGLSGLPTQRVPRQRPSGLNR